MPWRRLLDEILHPDTADVVAAVTADVSIGTGKAHANNIATFTTTNDVAAGAQIIMTAGRFNSNAGNTMAISGGGLTWVEDKTLTNGSIRTSMFRASAPAGLASGTTLTLTHSGTSPGATDSIFGGGSFLGIDTTGTVVTTGGGSGSTAAWSTGSIAATSGNALLGGAFMDGATTSSTPTSPGVELFDVNDATQTETETMVYKLSVAGSDSIGGTWASAAAWVAVGVCYKAAASAAASAPRAPIVSREAHRRSTRW